jgi:hypothetical protein
MSEWISVGESTPKVEIGDELHCFISKKRKSDGEVFVMDAYWVNKPIPDDLDDYDDMPDYVLHNSDGEPVSMSGWCERGCHPDFDGFYQQIDESYCEIVHWQQIQYPSPPECKQ